MNRNSTIKAKNYIAEERDSRFWWLCFCGLIGGIFLAAGFVYAAGLHFDALERSAKNVEMRRQREQLKTDRQRLLLTRETALSPAQLEKQAHKIGMQGLTASQIAKVGEVEAKTAESVLKNESSGSSAFIKSDKTDTDAKQSQKVAKR
jgi:hypothetical protein